MMTTYEEGQRWASDTTIVEIVEITEHFMRTRTVYPDQGRELLFRLDGTSMQSNQRFWAYTLRAIEERDANWFTLEIRKTNDNL
jgi:hypothetical protein